jgi:GNAT superfamily N-acetyltransferase
MTKIISFDRRYVKDFAELNKEWIRRYFVVEPMDTYQLDNPEETIISKGGEIFFVLEDEKCVGTCAMIPMENNGYELAKMAVSPAIRGRGLGDLLMTHSTNWAKEKGASYILLHSNTTLEPAITLYKKHGYVTTHLGPHPDYDRANIEMRLDLK